MREKQMNAELSFSGKTVAIWYNALNLFAKGGAAHRIVAVPMGISANMISFVDIEYYIKEKRNA